MVKCDWFYLIWDDLIKHFVLPIEIGCQFEVSYVIVPIESIVHPFRVIPDDGENCNRYIVVLPKRNWSAYFSRKILI